NRIYKNILWGVKGNYRSIPTDCPQRDERQGWLGDRGGESRGESYLFDVAAFYNKWMVDIKDSQKDSGSIPDVAPAYWPIYSDNTTWPGCYIIIPGTLYEQYGDMEVLRNHYPSMKKWVNYMKVYIKDNIMTKDTYGDWCVPPESQELIHSQDPNRRTVAEVIGTCYFYHELKLMARYAKLLGQGVDAKEFGELAEKMKVAFNEKYFNKDKFQYDNGSQTSSVLPLAFGMVPEEHKSKVFDKLVDKILVEGKGHIGTGLIGAQWLMRVLSDNGRPDVAYKIATQKTYPSWGYMIENGATTIWELWNGNTADPAMNSHNHVMLVGDLCTWMHEYLAGIRQGAGSVGFKKIVIDPVIVGDLTSAHSCYKSQYGRIFSDWKIEGEQLALKVVIPVNTTATVYVPAEKVENVTESGKAAVKSQGLKFLQMEDGKAVFSAGSGEYKFVSTLPPS
ncbi:MAG: alpha-rhamnosidase, partial [Deltaproteobacteria bacterium]|nr:alpha-rhamnosidase [Deltaproteobacteria bacterium]